MSPRLITVSKILELSGASETLYRKHILPVIGRSGRLIRACPCPRRHPWQYVVWQGIQPNPMHLDWGLYGELERLDHPGQRALYERLRFGSVQWPVWLCADYRGTKSRVGDWTEAAIEIPYP